MSWRMEQITGVYLDIIKEIDDEPALSSKVFRYFWNHMDEPATMEDICWITGITDRTARMITRRLRLGGLPIVASRHGYWLSTDREEIRAAKLRFRKRAEECRRVADALEEAERQLGAIERKEARAVGLQERLTI